MITLGCLGWFIINRSPYRFLAGAKRTAFYEEKVSVVKVSRLRRYPPSIRTSIVERYESKRSYDEVAREAKAEMIRVGRIVSHSSKSVDSPFILFSDPSTGTSVHLYRIGDLSVVQINRKVTPIDRLRLLTGKRDAGIEVSTSP